MSPEGDTIPFCRKHLIFYKSKGVIVLFEDILYAPKNSGFSCRKERESVYC